MEKELAVHQKRNEYLKRNARLLVAGKQRPVRIREEWVQDDTVVWIHAALCSSKMHLAHLPKLVKSHPEVYLCLLKEKRLAWKDVPEDVKTSPELCLKTNTGLCRWLLKEKRLAWKDVPEDVKCNPKVCCLMLKANLIAWEDVPEEVKQTDKEIALFGVRRDCIRANADDYPCLLDQPFMLKQLGLCDRPYGNNCLSWNRLPTLFKTDIEFARSFVYSSDVDLHAHIVSAILASFAPLCDERKIWLAFADDASEGGLLRGKLHNLIEKFAPTAIRSDAEFMLQAFESPEFRVLALVEGSLVADRDFFSDALEDNPGVLRYACRASQRHFPDLVDRAIQEFTEQGDMNLTEFHMLAENLPPEFWDNRDFLLRWFEGGLPFLSHPHSFRLPSPFYDGVDDERLRAWTEDKDIFLLIADYCEPHFRHRSFVNASVTLRRNKKFMLQVLAIDPSLAWAVAHEIRNDFHICLLSFSGENEHCTASGELVLQEVQRRRHKYHRRQHNYRRELDKLENFRSILTTRLDAHSIFSTILLPGISQTPDSGCTLAVLNQGAETSFKYKKVIAELLDVPTGKQLRLHQQAFDNLNEALAVISNES